MYNIMYIISCAIISFVHIVEFTPTVYGRTMENLAYASHPSCSYLSNDGTQFDAFQHPEVSSSYCCLCGLGTMIVGPCDVGDPRSTKCQECSEDEYIDFEPHFERKCFRKSWQTCPPPKLYSKGTNKESHRCVCPSGTVENGDDCLEAVVPPLLLVKMDVSVTTSPTTTGNLDNTSTNLSPMETMPSTSVSSTVSSEATARFGDVETSIPVTTQYKATISERTTKHPGTHNSLGRSSSKGDSYPLVVFMTIIILLLLVGIVVLIVARFIWFRRNVTELLNCTDKSPNSSRHTMATMTGTDSPYVTKIDKTNGCNTNSNRSTPTIGGRNSRAEEMPLTSPADDVHSTSGSCQVISEAGIAANKVAPAPSRASGSQNQDECPSIEERANIQRKAEKIPSKQNRQFACDVATKLGQKCRRDHVLAMFRLICGNEDEVYLKDLDENEKFTKEFLYQCMQHALTLIGEVNLSPFSLWDQISSMGFKEYTDIVSDEIEKYFQNIPLVPKTKTMSCLALFSFAL